jgi:ribonuclease D
MQDVKLLEEALDVPIPARLFDTQIAWALLGAEASVSLAYIQYKVCNVRSEKGHQADDWVRRPLPASQLRYAAADVAYLPEIHRTLLDRAQAKGRVEIIEQASQDALSPEREPPAPLRTADFRNAWQLDASGQAALQFLVDWYNSLPPDERTHAPENKTLLSLAARQPGNTDALGRIKGVSRSVLSHHGAALVRGIERAVASASGEGFVPMEPPAYATYQEIGLDAWLQMMRARVCERLEVAPELVLPARLLKRMAAASLVEGVEGLERSLVGWRRALLLEALRVFCQKDPPPLESHTS